MNTPAGGTALAFDHGQKRIGVAVGQQVTGTAVSLVTLTARDGQPEWHEVTALIDTWQPDWLVVGIPRHLDGAASESTRTAEKFARRLEGRYDIPVHLVDERLTSRQAESLIRERSQQGGRGMTDKGEVDKLSAQLILQDWLDRQQEKSIGE